MSPPPLTILVVDDDAINRTVIVEMLEVLADELPGGRGLTIEIAPGGAEALALLRSERRFDAMFLDLMMPVVDGFAVLADLRARRDQTPVVVMTAADEDLRAKVPLSQVVSIIVKPLNLARLKAALNVIASENRGQAVRPSSGVIPARVS